MRIQKISVTGLFGIFDHEIPLNIDDRITMIHSPNGFGKTIILKMLDGFFNSRYSIFQTIPFQEFRVDFDNKSSIKITKSNQDAIFLNFSKQFIYLNLFFYDCDLTTQKFSINISGDNMVETSFGDIVSQNVIIVNSSVSQTEKETNNLNNWRNRWKEIQSLKTNTQDEPEWLESLKGKIHIYFIESQRLLNTFTDRSSQFSFEPSSILLRVATYAEELAQLIQDKSAEYGTMSQSLDRTFPARVVQQRSSDLTEEQLRQKLNELEENRSRLIDVGLLDKDENSDFPIQPQSIDESTKNILSVYVEDVEKKLSVFDEIASKIELLKRIINNKFSYSYKAMKFSKEKGFIFTNCYDSTHLAPKSLSPTDLSSGEQHELVLLYELLFKVKPNSLVLIDEPELSLHVGWQVQFLKDLQEITKLANLDILMATHSPDIIQDRWDLTVELRGPGK